MPFPQFNRNSLNLKPLCQRKNKVFIERDHLEPDSPVHQAPDASIMAETIERICAARRNHRPVMLAFGAHSIKNGLGPVLIDLMERGWLTHLATNGAGIIHDWEFAFQGQSSEDVRANVYNGEFGTWQETGYYINLAIVVGAYEGMGYGESVGAMIEREGLLIPDTEVLQLQVVTDIETNPGQAAAAADLLQRIRQFDLKPGWLAIPHPTKRYSVQANAFRLKIPFTSHPMFGHDIIYTHPMNDGAAIGRAAERDFLTFAENVRHLEGGVYLSVGSAVMSPMIFEKSLSMSQNLELQEGRRITNHYMVIVDLAKSSWDWSKDGEPPMDNPAYYLRYCKTFNRMGGTMRYLCADNRDFLLTLSQRLPHSASSLSATT